MHFPGSVLHGGAAMPQGNASHGGSRPGASRALPPCLRLIRADVGMSAAEPPSVQSGDRRGSLVDIENLTKVYRMRSGTLITALRDISLTIERGETLGLVGESGCGKS